MALQRITFAALFALLLASTIPAQAQSYEWAKKSVITLEDMSEVPGMVLEPGTYVLKAEDNLNSPRTVVQLLNKDESQILTTFLAVPDNRVRPESDVVLTFFDGVTAGPKPIQTWFYPGEMNGYEFVYPPSRAKEIAKHTQDHVIASDSKESAIVAITPSGTEVPLYDALNKSRKATATQDTQREKPQETTTSQTSPKKSKRVPPKQQ
jgi:hypothetical protein